MSTNGTDLNALSSIIASITALASAQNGSAPVLIARPPTIATNTLPSSPIPSPSSLPRFLRYAKAVLGVANVLSYESAMQAHDYGPDILHLVEEASLCDIGLTAGDAICLKAGSLTWWNSPNSRKRDWEDDVGNPEDLTPTAHDSESPSPNKKVRFERRWFDIVTGERAGAHRFYGPCLGPANPDADNTPASNLDTHLETWFYCEAREGWAIIPQGMVAVTDDDEPSVDNSQASAQAW